MSIEDEQCIFLQESKYYQLKFPLKKQKAAKASKLAAIFTISIEAISRNLEILEKRASNLSQILKKAQTQIHLSTGSPVGMYPIPDFFTNLKF